MDENTNCDANAFFVGLAIYCGHTVDNAKSILRAFYNGQLNAISDDEWHMLLYARSAAELANGMCRHF